MAVGATVGADVAGRGVAVGDGSGVAVAATVAVGAGVRVAARVAVAARVGIDLLTKPLELFSVISEAGG